MSNTEVWEPMLGYCTTFEQTYDKPVRLDSEAALMAFMVENIEKFYELRITDLGDNCTMQIVQGALMFPLPEGRSCNNKWNAELQRFLTLDDKSAWVSNTGVKPDAKRVDIKLNCYEEEWPGVDCIRYNQNPSDWDWTLLQGDSTITHYRECK
jgi:hypothetical protein